MKPTDAGFDGEKGINLNLPDYFINGGFLKLRRGKKPLQNYPDLDFRNQLIWYYPDNKDAELLYCNQDNQWFKLDFTPIELNEIHPS